MSYFMTALSRLSHSAILVVCLLMGLSLSAHANSSVLKADDVGWQLVPSSQGNAQANLHALAEAQAASMFLVLTSPEAKLNRLLDVNHDVGWQNEVEAYNALMVFENAVAGNEASVHFIALTQTSLATFWLSNANNNLRVNDQEIAEGVTNLDGVNEALSGNAIWVGASAQSSTQKTLRI